VDLDRAVLDALPTRAAIVDRAGTIVLVNRQWREFAKTNGRRMEHFGVGSNYLEVCARASNESAEATAMAAGLKAVLAGE
jgi:hypothetical protein